MDMGCLCNGVRNRVTPAVTLVSRHFFFSSNSFAVCDNQPFFVLSSLLHTSPNPTSYSISGSSYSPTPALL